MDAERDPNHKPVQVDGMNKQSETGLSVSGCMQPDTVKSNHADLFVPVLTASANAYKGTLLMMTNKELHAAVYVAKLQQKLASCTVAYLNRDGGSLWIHSFHNINIAVKEAIESQTWHLNWKKFAEYTTFA